MKLFRVWVDDEPYRDCIGWSTPGGNCLVLDFKDGKTKIFSGWIDITIEIQEAK